MFNMHMNVTTKNNEPHGEISRYGYSWVNLDELRWYRGDTTFRTGVSYVFTSCHHRYGPGQAVVSGSSVWLTARGVAACCCMRFGFGQGQPVVGALGCYSSPNSLTKVEAPWQLAKESKDQMKQWIDIAWTWLDQVAVESLWLYEQIPIFCGLRCGIAEPCQDGKVWSQEGRPTPPSTAHTTAEFYSTASSFTVDAFEAPRGTWTGGVCVCRSSLATQLGLDERIDFYILYMFWHFLILNNHYILGISWASS